MNQIFDCIFLKQAFIIFNILGLVKLLYFCDNLLVFRDLSDEIVQGFLVWGRKTFSFWS